MVLCLLLRFGRKNVCLVKRSENRVADQNVRINAVWIYLQSFCDENEAFLAGYIKLDSAFANLRFRYLQSETL